MNLLGPPLESGLLKLHSPLPPAECAARLADATKREDFYIFRSWGIFGPQPFAGRVEGMSFRLRKRIGFSNDLFLTGALRPWGNGTSVQGCFATHGCASVFTILGPSVLLIFCGLKFFTSILLLIFSSTPPKDAWTFILLFPWAIFCGLFFLRIHRALSRDQARFLTDELRVILQATESKATS